MRVIIPTQGKMSLFSKTADKFVLGITYSKVLLYLKHLSLHLESLSPILCTGMYMGNKLILKVKLDI